MVSQKSAQVRDTHRRSSSSLGLGAAAALALVGGSSCYSQNKTTCGQENEVLAPLKGTVVDATTQAPLGGSLVFVELCELYSFNPNKAAAHPNYRYGTVAAADGSFEVMVPKGPVGLHTFKEGYRYGSLKVDDSTASGLVVRTSALLAGDVRPTASGFSVDTRVAKPGQTLSFAVDVKAAPKDPMSEEVVVLEAKTKDARAFKPPFRRTNDAFLAGFPSGRWTATFEAPTTPGEYEYVFGYTSENCIVGDGIGVGKPEYQIKIEVR